MSTFLFDKTIFGPVKSRRLGISLGINLLPNTQKVCNFNCIYCECGWNPKGKNIEKLPKADYVASELSKKLKEMKENKQALDVITFAGNGEPTMHPDFPKIIDSTIEIRNQFFPNVKIAVLSNSTMVYKPKIFEALKKIDLNILKIDSAIENTCRLLNNPVGIFSLDKLVQNLARFEGKLMIQTMFVKGIFNGVPFDNSTNFEVDTLIKMIKKISPSLVMLYTVERDTPSSDIQKISLKRLNEILAKFEQNGIECSISE